MKVRLWLLLSVSVSIITWLYITRIVAPWNDYIGEYEHGGLKAQMWDLYPRWVGARALLLEGRNPYGPEVSHEIQMAYYGHTITQDYSDTSHKIVDEQRFAYPVYVVFLMAPTVLADFAEVYRWGPVVLGLLAALCVPLSLDLLQWRLPRPMVAALALFTVSSPQIAQGMRHQQLAIVVGLTLIAGAWCVRRNQLLCAGAVLAWSTIKPQMSVFPLCFFLLWVMGDWPRRWKLLAGFLLTLATLVAAGDLILPGWIGYFVEGALAYRQYFPTTSLVRLALGDWAGGIVSGIVIAFLLLLAWRNRQADAASPEFVQTLSAFLIGATLVLPLLTPFNQVLLVLPAMMLLRNWNTLLPLGRRAFFFMVAWPWIASLVLLLLHPRPDSTRRLLPLPLLPLALVLFVPFLFALLFATRSGPARLPAANR